MIPDYDIGLPFVLTPLSHLYLCLTIILTVAGRFCQITPAPGITLEDSIPGWHLQILFDQSGPAWHLHLHHVSPHTPSLGHKSGGVTGVLYQQQELQLFLRTIYHQTSLKHMS